MPPRVGFFPTPGTPREAEIMRECVEAAERMTFEARAHVARRYRAGKL
jgi:hypothetical protein